MPKNASKGCAVAAKGSKDMPVLSTGHDKAHITVMLTARADGTKCKPLIVVNRERPDKDLIKRF